MWIIKNVAVVVRLWARIRAKRESIKGSFGLDEQSGVKPKTNNKLVRVGVKDIFRLDLIIIVKVIFIIIRVWKLKIIYNKITRRKWISLLKAKIHS